MQAGPTPQEDVQLIRKTLQGSEVARESLMGRLHCIEPILKSRNRRLASPLSADELKEVAQDVVTAVWGRLDSYRGEGPLEAWVYRFCVNVLMNAVTRRRKDAEGRISGEEKDFPAPTLTPLEVDERELLLQALESLPAEEAEVIELKYLEGLTFADIAERIPCPPNSAKSRFYRGLERLRQRLGPILREEAP